MIESIQEALGKKAIIDYFPMQMGDVNKTVSDCSKAKRLLGYEPKIKFKEGLRRYIEYEERIHNKKYAID